MIFQCYSYQTFYALSNIITGAIIIIRLPLGELLLH